MQTGFFKAAFVAAMLAPLSASAAAWYVSASGGSNANSGTDSGTPWATLQYAINNPLVMSGDSIFGVGTFSENLSITKSLHIFAEVKLTTLTASNGGHGIEALTDGIDLRGMTVTAGDLSAYTNGILVYAADTSDGVLSGFYPPMNVKSFDFATFPPAVPSGCTALVIHNPEDMIMSGTSIELSGRTTPTRIVDNGIVIYGGQVNTLPANRIVNCRVSPGSSYSVAGTGLSIRPGEGPSAGKPASHFYLGGDLFHFGISTGFELRDERTGANEGISDIEWDESLSYFADVGVRVAGMANDPGIGISNVEFKNSNGEWNFVANVETFRFEQTGIGTSNIDFDSLRIRNCTISAGANPPTQSYAVNNTIPGTTVDAQFNHWGSMAPKVFGLDTITSNSNVVSQGVDFTPYLSGFSRTSSSYEDVTTPGGSASLNDLSSGPTHMELMLNPGITGEVAMWEFNYGSQLYPPSGFVGIVDDEYFTTVAQVQSTLNDGEFIALIDVTYSQFTFDNDFTTPESDLILYYFDIDGGSFRPAVLGNIGGTAQWLGDAPLPTLPLTVADLGKYGVDTSTNQIWAVVNHFTDFAAGAGSNGGGDTTAVARWSIYE